MPPGEYVPDATEGVTGLDALPPRRRRRSRLFRRRRCPSCGHLAEVFPGVPHRVCVFHVPKDVTAAVRRTPAGVRKRLAARIPP